MFTTYLLYVLNVNLVFDKDKFQSGEQEVISRFARLPTRIAN